MSDERDITVALTPQQWTPDQVKQYVDVLVAEQRLAIERRTETSRHEIDAVAQVAKSETNAVRVALADLRNLVVNVSDERQRAVELAERERERAALELRSELLRAIAEGDENLRQHVVAQKEQIDRALESANLLERERIALIVTDFKQYQKRTEDQTAFLVSTREHEYQNLKEILQAQITAVADQLSAQAAAQKEAILKAEAANADKFLSHNGLIEQMRQQAVKSEQTLAGVVGTLLPRETFDTYKEGVEQRLNQTAGEARGQTTSRQHESTANGQRLQLWAIIEALVVGVLAIVVTIAIATRGFH